MASSVVPDAVSELQAAIDVLLPKIRGLDDLSHVSLSPDLLAFVQRSITAHNQRLGNLVDAVQILQALMDDGYPEPLVTSMDSKLFDELRGQLDDLKVAAGEFFPQQPATDIAVDLGAPIAKD